MTPDPKDDPSEKGTADSVLNVVRKKTGGAPEVSLHDEPSGLEVESFATEAGTDPPALSRSRGDYRVLGEIARGGMGVVLRGHDADLGRDVALKVLNPELVDRPDVLQRFVEEAQIGGQLQHPGIVPVYELGLMADERPYFSMKLVKGRTLATLIAERTSPSDDRRTLLGVFESVCQTMGYAHSRGVLHRDLKPANVMVGAFGEVQVVDWGLAKVLERDGANKDADTSASRPVQTVLETIRSAGKEGSGSGTDSIVGSVLGTPDYMPPEQAQGHVDRLDERSDVFSLGAILCEILTGYPPYHREDGEQDTIADAALGRLDRANRRLDACGADPALVEMARQCLFVAPAARPRHAGILAERIHDHLVSVEERAHAAQIEAAVQRRGRKLTLALAATIVVASLGGGGGWLWLQQQELNREQERARRRQEMQASIDTALDEANREQSGQGWEAALAAIAHARGLAEMGPADEEVLRRIDAAEGRIHAAIDEERTRAERTLANERFLADVAEALHGQQDEVSNQHTDQLCSQVFSDHGIEVDDSPPAAVAAALSARGIGPEISPLLHEWLIRRREVSREAADGGVEDKRAVVQLVDIAHAVDSDPLHADLREAMLNDEVEVLRDLAAGDLSDLRPSTLNLLATALFFAEEMDEAQRVAQTGVQLHPDDASLQSNLARSLWNGGRMDAAIARLRATQALRPRDLQLRLELYRALREQAARLHFRGEERAAFDLNQEAIAEIRYRIDHLEDFDAHEMERLGVALRDAGDSDGAVRCYRRALDLTHLHDSVFANLAATHVWMGEFDEALAVYDRLALTEDWDLSYDTVRMRAQILRAIGNGDLEEARGAMFALLDRWGGTADARSFAGHRLSYLRRHEVHEMVGARDESARREADEAMAVLMQDALDFVEDLSGNPLWLQRRGLLRHRLGDDEGALDDLERSQALEERDSTCFYLACVLETLGREADARRRYQEGMALTRRSGHSASLAYTVSVRARARREAADVLGIQTE